MRSYVPCPWTAEWLTSKIRIFLYTQPTKWRVYIRYGQMKQGTLITSVYSKLILPLGSLNLPYKRGSQNYNWRSNKTDSDIQKLITFGILNEKTQIKTGWRRLRIIYNFFYIGLVRIDHYSLKHSKLTSICLPYIVWKHCCWIAGHLNFRKS